MLSTRRPGRDVLGGRLLPPERRGARTSVVVPVLPPDRLYPYPLPFDEGNCHDVCEHRLLVTSYQVSMRRRIGLAVVLAVSLALAPFSAEAQPANKVPRIGVLWGGPAEFAKPYLEAGRRAAADLGYVEGRDFAVEYAFGERKPGAVDVLAPGLVQRKVDVIVAAGDPAIFAARRATSTIPIVMVAAGDPVGGGLVASLA